MYAAPPAAAEVCSDVYGAYRAHAKAKFRACEYAPMPNVVNLLFLSLPTMFCFLPGCCSLGSRKGQQSGPWLSLSNKVTRYRKSPGRHRRSTNFKKRTYRVIVCIKLSRFRLAPETSCNVYV